MSLVNLPTQATNNSNISSENITVFEFNGWLKTHNDWCKWVKRLQPIHESTWRRAGIFEAIKTSTLKLHKNEEIILGLAQKWRPSTSSFIFRWGEASVTLEDVCLLGGFSVMGNCVSTSVPSDMFPEEARLVAARRVINQTSAKKCTYTMWLKLFMENTNGFDDIEHEAFLVFWLSKFVFPKVKDVVEKHVHSIAIQLAKGTRIALAPAILAALYADLGRIKNEISTFSPHQSTSGKKTISTWSLVHLLQAWVWERFPTLAPNPNQIQVGEPRLARWHDLKAVRVNDVKGVLDVIGKEFQWRPYCKIREESLEWEIASDQEVEQFTIFITPSELVGLEGLNERYQPQRVSMQFGLDQGNPSPVSRLNESPNNLREFSNKRTKVEDESDDEVEDPLNVVTTGELLKLACKEMTVVKKKVTSKKKRSFDE